MKYLLFIFCVLAWNCTDDTPVTDPGSDVKITDKSDTGTDVNTEDVNTKEDLSVNSDTSEDVKTDTSIEDGELPPEFAFEGVAYIGHLESGILQWIRTDGTPRLGGEIDLGQAIIELAVDRKNHLLGAALPGVREVKLFQIDTPTNNTMPINPPTELATITFDAPVLGIKFDPFHNRFYAMKTLPLPAGGGPQTNAELYVYNIEDPAQPTQIGSAITVPTTVSWDIDPVRQILFLFDGVNDLLHGYDLAGDDIKALPGDPIDFKVWYPETNQNGFTVRNLKVDPWSNRIFGARAQGALSELITVQYDSVIPDSTQTFSDLSSMNKLEKKDDGFDTSVALEDRPFILDAANPVIDRINGMIWLVTASWNGTRAAYGAMTLRDDTLALDKNCEESATGLMCWYRSFFGSAEQTRFHDSDGAACVDGTNKVFVGTSYDPQDNTQAGDVHLFSYTATGEMTRIVLERSTVKAFPVAAICH